MYDVIIHFFCDYTQVFMQRQIIPLYYCANAKLFCETIQEYSGWQRSVELPFEAIGRRKKLCLPTRLHQLQHQLLDDVSQ